MKKIITIVSLFFFGLNTSAQEMYDEQYMNAFIVVSDTSQNYFDVYRHDPEVEWWYRIWQQLLRRRRRRR